MDPRQSIHQPIRRCSSRTWFPWVTEKNICQIRDTNVGGNYSVSGCKRKHAWFVITSSLLAFLGEAHSWNIQTISGSQTHKYLGFRYPHALFFMFFLFCWKAEVSARNSQHRLVSSNLPFGKCWDILKPRLPLPIFHYTNILIYPNYLNIFPQIPWCAQTIPLHFLV